MTAYSITLMVHLSAVALSGAFFLLRGIWMLAESPLLTAKPVRILPHIIDTVLLISAFTLAYFIGSYPFFEPWLTAKFIALFVYIGLGMVALKRGKTKSIRSIALVAALLTFAYIATVAVTRSPSAGLF